MTTVGRWSPNKVRARVLDGTWVSTEELGGMVLLTPTSIAYTGGGSETATIGANGSVEFTSCTSLSLNGVFSADYDNYMISCRLGSTATSSDGVFAKLRASGVDASTNYVRQYIVASSTTVAANRLSAQTSTVFSDTRNTLKEGFTVYMYGPFLTQPTAGRSNTVVSDGNARFTDYAWTHSTSASYDGFSAFLSSGNYMSGLVSVYGLVGA